MCLSFIFIKTYFRAYCQKHKYIFYMGIGFYLYTLNSKMNLNILFSYLYKFIEKLYFPLEVWFLENTSFGLKLNFYITKIVQINLNMSWFLVTHICSTNFYKNLFL